MQCTREGVGLSPFKPRYLMGVGYPEDIVICVSLGCDLFDCVYPTRTARFGAALTAAGIIKIKQHKYAADLLPLDPSCSCYTCSSFSRAYLHHTFNKVNTYIHACMHTFMHACMHALVHACMQVCMHAVANNKEIK